MSELEYQPDEQFDATVRGHLAAMLDPQRGRARLAFRRHVGLEPAADDAPAVPLRYEAPRSAGPVDRNPWWWRRGPWALAMVGSALAASLLTALAAPVIWGGRAASVGAPGGGNSSFPSATIQPTPVTRMDESVQSQLYDGGMYITPDGTPVRQLRRLNVHERVWENPATGERMKQVVPSEDVMIYELKTY